MPTSAQHGSARIYAFPARGRFLSASHHAASQADANDPSSVAADVMWGSNWYHEEAIRDAETSRKN